MFLLGKKRSEAEFVNDTEGRGFHLAVSEGRKQGFLRRELAATGSLGDWKSFDQKITSCSRLSLPRRSVRLVISFRPHIWCSKDEAHSREQ